MDDDDECLPQLKNAQQIHSPESHVCYSSKSDQQILDCDLSWGGFVIRIKRDQKHIRRIPLF